MRRVLLLCNILWISWTKEIRSIASGILIKLLCWMKYLDRLHFSPKCIPLLFHIVYWLHRSPNVTTCIYIVINIIGQECMAFMREEIFFRYPLYESLAMQEIKIYFTILIWKQKKSSAIGWQHSSSVLFPQNILSSEKHETRCISLINLLSVLSFIIPHTHENTTQVIWDLLHYCCL